MAQPRPLLRHRYSADAAYPRRIRPNSKCGQAHRQDVRAGRFRSDLYYRLAVLEIRLPPLRERREDLPPLVGRFLRELGASEAECKPIRSDEFKAQLARHSWPGNVRELRNYVERCLALNAPLWRHHLR